MSLEDMKTMPHILKPFTLVLSVLFCLFTFLCPYRAFIWIPEASSVIMVIVTLVVFILHLIDTAVLISTPIYPFIELGYTAIFFIACLLSVIVFFCGLFFTFDLLLIVSIGLSVLLGMSFGLMGMITWRSRNTASTSNNQATASPSFPAGINPGV
ncbi:hypothetical protein PRIPAC_87266 [Pristionchus pacificus]|uniref:Uncharacterized protein n=1 Tax=Pristionchus pacificus TaxID=54126 RepID=A0A2A6BZN2_PRIPA|nr:hypothetical protein PRIPAC_87266 [Pristionchus pacificus]|eukprot:PDM71233.1 hypothetical protein PRIPAC_43616 [Pristionchus pacificus]